MTSRLDSAYVPLRLAYGVVPIAAGVDKFFNVLTDWGKYLPEIVASNLPMPVPTFMMVVGVIEIVAGLAVLSIMTRLGALVVALWLIAVGSSAGMAGYLDILVRDLVMAVGAYALCVLAGARGEAWLPGARPVAPRHAGV